MHLPLRYNDGRPMEEEKIYQTREELIARFDAVRLTIQGRECAIDVADVPNDCPVLSDQIPLEMLEFVFDLRRQKLIGNPEHGGELMIDAF